MVNNKEDIYKKRLTLLKNHLSKQVTEKQQIDDSGNYYELNKLPQEYPIEYESFLDNLIHTDSTTTPTTTPTDSTLKFLKDVPLKIGWTVTERDILTGITNFKDFFSMYNTIYQKSLHVLVNEMNVIRWFQDKMAEQSSFYMVSTSSIDGDHLPKNNDKEKILTFLKSRRIIEVDERRYIPILSNITYKTIKKCYLVITDRYLLILSNYNTELKILETVFLLTLTKYPTAQNSEGSSSVFIEYKRLETLQNKSMKEVKESLILDNFQKGFADYICNYFKTCLTLELSFTESYPKKKNYLKYLNDNTLKEVGMAPQNLASTINNDSNHQLCIKEVNGEGNTATITRMVIGFYSKRNRGSPLGAEKNKFTYCFVTFTLNTEQKRYKLNFQSCKKSGETFEFKRNLEIKEMPTEMCTFPIDPNVDGPFIIDSKNLALAKQERFISQENYILLTKIFNNKKVSLDSEISSVVNYNLLEASFKIINIFSS